MANRKISDLTALTAPATGDLLPIVDISEAAAADKNKKITLGTLLSGAPLGSAAAPSIAFTGDTNTGIYSPGADTIAASTGGTERLRIDSSGRLLVGTSSARTSASHTGSLQLEGTTFSASTLSVIGNASDSSGAYLHLGKARGGSIGSTTVVAVGDTLGQIHFTGSDGTNLINGAIIGAVVDGTPGANDMPSRLVFSTTADGAASPTEAMRITSAQNIRIGTTGDGSGSTTGRIRLTGNAGGINSIYTEQAVSGGYNFVSSTVSNGGTYYHANFLEGGTQRGSITSNGVATVYATTSDYRLKENVAPVSDGITRFKQLKPSRFNFISHPDRTIDGFLAHEAQEIVPECVIGTKDEVDADGNPIYQGIDQSKLVPLLTAALQEAIARIETLETRLSALEGA